MKKRIISIYILAAFTLSLGSCKKWLDVNDNPNLADNPAVSLVLPSAELTIANVMGNAFQINGSFWAQHWTQSPLANQYKNIDNYQVSSDNYNRPWQNMYAGALTDLKYVYNQAKSENRKQYMAIARLLQAYSYQVLTDAFGDIPFSEAVKGATADGAITNPKYDSQEAVYDGIIGLIDEAQLLLDPNDLSHPSTDDLIFGGDMTKWVEFANTLKLKVYMRLSEANPTKAKDGIAGITGNFLSSSAKISYSTTGGNENPLYGEMVGLSRTTNIFASKTCVDSMNAVGDPRVFIFYTPLTSGAVVGLKQGDFANSSSATGKSLAGAYVGANPNTTKDPYSGITYSNVSAVAPVFLLSLEESDFLQAEAVARGWMTGDDAALYEAGIRASMDDYQNALMDQVGAGYIDTTGFGDLNGYINDLIANYIPYPTSGTFDDKLRSIITQKWIAMSGNQGFEAWTEQRRTGYPVLEASVANFTGGLLPQRFVYPTNEVNLNSKFPGTKKVTEKVWWDKN